MQMRGVLYFVIAVGLASVTGCGGISPTVPKGYKELVGDVVPLTGEVTLDGSPAQGLSVWVLNEKSMPQYLAKKDSGDQIRPFATGTFKADGTFQFTTLTAGDGLPAGNYIICFSKAIEAGTSNPEAEKFNALYAKPDTSKYKATLEKGKPVDLGKIELSTK